MNKGTAGNLTGGGDDLIRIQVQGSLIAKSPKELRRSVP
jgi:hypothetical protein